jgi:hypothetical protein
MDQNEIEQAVPNPLELPTTRELIRHMCFEMKFLGIYYIITGALASLTIIGAIIGIPILLSGLRLIDSSKKFLSFRDTLSADDLLKALFYQRSYFRINFWFVVIGFIIFVLYMVFIALFFSHIVNQVMQDTPLFS